MSTGDHGFFGWLQTALYFVAAWACRRRSGRVGFPEARVWLILAVVCLLLGLNKQLDVQIWLLQELKELVQLAQLAERKNLVRVVVLLAGAGFVLISGVCAVAVVRRASSGLRIAVTGLVLLGPFAVLRMARFSKLPTLLGSGGGLDVALELVPTVLVLFGALSEPSRVRRVGRA